MQWLLRHWKTTLFLIADVAYNYLKHNAIVTKAVRLGKPTHATIPEHYRLVVFKHMNLHVERIEEANKPKLPKEKFPSPYFYVPGKGTEEELNRVRHDFKKTYAYNAKVDKVMEKAGIPQNDAYSEAMKLAPKFL